MKIERLKAGSLRARVSMATTTNPLLQQIDAIAKEKGVEPEIIISAVQDALEAAARKKFKSEALRARFNQETGQLELYAVKKIVAEVTDASTQISLGEAQQLYGEEAEVDMEIEFPRPTEDLGRIAAQTAKQVIFQKVREAERENVYAEYSQRVGDVVSGMVKRFENGDIIIELGRVEAQLPRKEQSRAENYTAGDRVRAVIRGVNRSAKGPQVVLSRTDPALLIKLFEQEVPEIYDGTVMIRGAVREAGDRAKVAVYSRERDVDPVGACVGMKGTRVQSIIRELRGEKIDIVEYSEDPILFVTNAISPAKVQRVSIVDDAERVMEVIVEDKQLSLAIGKKGQNVRLAAKLTGWKIDIKSEEEKRKEVEAQLGALEIGEPVDRRGRGRCRGGRNRRCDGGVRRARRVGGGCRRRHAGPGRRRRDRWRRSGRSRRARGERTRQVGVSANSAPPAGEPPSTKRGKWRQFGFTRSRSSSIRRARK